MFRPQTRPVYVMLGSGTGRRLMNDARDLRNDRGPLIFSLPSRVSWDLLLPLTLSFPASVVIYGPLTMAAVILVLAGTAGWLLSSDLSRRRSAVTVLAYGLCLVPAPVIVMMVALWTTRNQ